MKGVFGVSDKALKSRAKVHMAYDAVDLEQNKQECCSLFQEKKCLMFL